ncbi:MAG: polyphosphate:AMP phosphotransferase [Clostridiales bacterium]|jgi:polyphosphate:AMP phosphotransferase|nr:polyphosphate:AMP phosphotransferase [Clostridiales bacterium]
MLEKVDLSVRIEKKEYKAQTEVLAEKWQSLQLKIKDLKIPVLIVLEGWSASGKGTLISKLVNPLDPRYYNVYTINRAAEENAMRPHLYPFFRSTPEKGRIAIFDKSWHRGLIPEHLEKRPLTKLEKASYYEDINDFEEQLANDGAVIAKFFLHMSKKEQKGRFAALSSNPVTAWRVDEGDKSQNKNYEKYLPFFEEMIERTNTGRAPWFVVEADDSGFAAVKIYKILTELMEERIAERAGRRLSGEARLPLGGESILKSFDAKKNITDENYKRRIAAAQAKMTELCYKLYAKRRSVVIAYEGWDAAGKGGNIKRLTQPMDPRAYEVVPVAAPSKEELDHHYLWRFWNKYPKDGHIAIFDRTWYGRVLVERVERYCADDEWRRAYKEINDMERQFYNHGTILFKFWLQIDKDEQLARFNARQGNPLKQYKITEEDWRNREKWDLYEQAIGDMLLMTDTEYAPWTVVESNSKKFARVKVVEHVISVLEKEL